MKDMDKANIQIAQRLVDRIKENDRVIEHFKRILEAGKASGAADGLANFLTNCGNLGSGTMKTELAKMMIESGVEVLKSDNEKFEAEIEKL